MNVIIAPRRYTGKVRIPPSKSHTIRQLLIASLADGSSQIVNPLDSLDTRSCFNICKALGVEITENLSDQDTIWKVNGIDGFKKRSLPANLKLDVGNSGTTLYLMLAVAGLQSEWVEFTGDEQIQKRSAAPLLDALSGLGVQVRSNNGCAPICVKGPWKGGKVSLSCPTSQYLSALLISAPLAPAGTITEIDVTLLNEKPYIDMTLSYLNAHNIKFEASSDYSHFVIPGGSSWKSFSAPVPADFSSAAFPAAAAAISCGDVELLGLDPNDTQGDKYFFEILKNMGCSVEWSPAAANAAAKSAAKSAANSAAKSAAAVNTVRISRNGSLRGGTFDLGDTPDLFPAAAVVSAFANGDTSLINVEHARIKETDRIAVTAQELAKLGVSCTERRDGLIIHGKGGISPVNSLINGHGDHRIVMAFGAAALGSPIPLEITTAESAEITYPGGINRLFNSDYR